jgi:ABC-type glycerol-3-phosphate transport system substrate-binding protein
LVEGSTEQEVAKHFVKFLTSPSVAKLVRETGLDPATSK